MKKNNKCNCERCKRHLVNKNISKEQLEKLIFIADYLSVDSKNMAKLFINLLTKIRNIMLKEPAEDAAGSLALLAKDLDYSYINYSLDWLDMDALEYEKICDNLFGERQTR